MSSQQQDSAVESMKGGVPRKADLSKEFPKEACNFHIFSESIGLRIANHSSIADFTQKLRNDIIVALDLVSQ